jgi:dsDNA-specific endonuclease/ATPase MutS2
MAYNKHIININHRKQDLRKTLLNKLTFDCILDMVMKYGLTQKFNEKYYEVMIQKEIERNTKIFREINEFNKINEINKINKINEIETEINQINEFNEINEIETEINHIENKINKLTNQIYEIKFK